MAGSELYLPGNNSGLLVHPDYEGQVSDEWFNPDYWGRQARTVDSGGRGGAWYVHSEGTSLVLRQYLRGGLASRLSGASYLYTGEEYTRSFAEFRLLNRLYNDHLPVPKPIAARYKRVNGIFYKAWILVEQFKSTAPLGDVLDQFTTEDWHRLGQLIRRFHDAGVYHADLNCFNVLVRGDQLYLIDFDKSLVVDSSASTRWKETNLKRLVRSLAKIAGDVAAKRYQRALYEGYQRSQDT